MLAYLFWHRPSEPAAAEAYERAQLAFHRSLARTPPVGMRGSAVFRVAELPWLAPPTGAGPEQPGATAPGYEDWYLLEDFAALGVLNEAAVGRGHVTTHDEVARRLGGGAGGLYGLVEGEPGADLLGTASLAVWVGRPPGSTRCMLGELLGDGMDPSHASLWRRHLVLGPAPEFCLLARDRSAPPPAAPVVGRPPGVAPTRLPDGWTATTLKRELLWNG